MWTKLNSIICILISNSVYCAFCLFKISFMERLDHNYTDFNFRILNNDYCTKISFSCHFQILNSTFILFDFENFMKFSYRFWNSQIGSSSPLTKLFRPFLSTPFSQLIIDAENSNFRPRQYSTETESRNFSSRQRLVLLAKSNFGIRFPRTYKEIHTLSLIVQFLFHRCQLVTFLFYLSLFWFLLAGN